MNKHTLTARPALTAIAAALVFSATPALAQEIEPAAPSSAPAPADSIVIPSQQPAQASPFPGAQSPQIAVPTLPPVAAAPAPAPVVAPPLPQVSTQQTVRNEAPVREAAPARERAAPVVTRAAVAERATPTDTPQPSVAPAPVVTPAAPSPALTGNDLRTIDENSQPAEAAPAPATIATDDSTTYWAIGAGGAVLLLGVGALAMLRRRDRRDDVNDELLATDTVVEREPLPIAPAVAGTPVAPGSWTTPTISEPVHAPVPVAAYEAPAVARTPAYAGASDADSHHSALEAMVARAPSEENPFVTRKQRLRRAEFLLNQGHASAAPASAPAMADAPSRPAAAAQSAEQPVYSFGRQSSRPKGWKPATT